MDLHIRDSQPRDLPFLREMLYEAVFWRAGADGPSLEEGLAYPEVGKVLAGWDERAGDMGVVATGGSTRIGTAWCRLWTSDDHMRGYVDNSTPVLVVAVRSVYRRRGVGGTLIDRLVDRSTAQGIRQLSLAVSKDNDALRLYRRHGFVEHADIGDTLLMVRRLRP